VVHELTGARVGVGALGDTGTREKGRANARGCAARHRGRSGARWCGWGGHSRRGSTLACARKGTRTRRRLGACTPGRKPTGAATPQFTASGTPTSSARGGKLAKGVNLPCLAYTCVGARARGCVQRSAWRTPTSRPRRQPERRRRHDVRTNRQGR
jgi:hypothetical protein